MPLRDTTAIFNTATLHPRSHRRTTYSLVKDYEEYQLEGVPDHNLITKDSKILFRTPYSPSNFRWSQHVYGKRYTLVATYEMSLAFSLKRNWKVNSRGTTLNGTTNFFSNPVRSCSDGNDIYEVHFCTGLRRKFVLNGSVVGYLQESEWIVVDGHMATIYMLEEFMNPVFACLIFMFCSNRSWEYESRNLGLLWPMKCS